MFPRFLKPEVVVANYAESGETLKAFRRENRLAKILMYSGDARIFNVGSGRGYSINEIVEKIGIITDKNPQIVYKNNRCCDVQTNILDSTLAKQELNWTPETPLDKGIAIVYRWMSEALATQAV